MSAPQINISHEVDQWARVTIERFKEAIGKYKTTASDGPLLESFVYQLRQNGGDVEAVVLKFRQYGRYWDMRVGRSLPLGNKKRKKAPWYSKTKTREIAYLRLILVRDYGINTLAELEQAFSATETLNLS